MKLVGIGQAWPGDCQRAHGPGSAILLFIQDSVGFDWQAVAYGRFAGVIAEGRLKNCSVGDLMRDETGRKIRRINSSSEKKKKM